MMVLLAFSWGHCTRASPIPQRWIRPYNRLSRSYRASARIPMSLSICLLTRDAEPQMERALRSVGPSGPRSSSATPVRATAQSRLPRPWGPRCASFPGKTISPPPRTDARPGYRRLGALAQPRRGVHIRGAAPLAALLARPEALAYVVRLQEVMQPDRQDSPAAAAGAMETL